MLFNGKRITAQLLIATVAVFLVLGLAACGKKKGGNTVELLETAYKQAQDGNWDKALKLAGKAADNDPKNMGALLMLGICQENNNQAAAALLTFKKAVESDPTSVLALYHQGRLQYQNGNYEESLNALREAEKLNPDNENVMLLLGQLEEKLKLPTAINYYKKLAASQTYHNKAGIWNQLGIFYCEQRENTSALKSFAQAYRLAPDDNLICLNFAVFLDRYLNTSASRNKAIQFYKKYLTLTKANPELKQQRDRVLARVKALLAQ